MSSASLDELLAKGDLDGLLHLIDDACAVGDWATVEQVAERSRPAVERGHQLISRITAQPGIDATLIEGQSTVGGGAAPGATISSRLLEISIQGLTPTTAARRLRESTPPVVARIERDRLLIDLRTVAPSDDDILLSVLTRVAEVEKSKQG